MSDSLLELVVLDPRCFGFAKQTGGGGSSRKLLAYARLRSGAERCYLDGDSAAF